MSHLGDSYEMTVRAADATTQRFLRRCCPLPLREGMRWIGDSLLRACYRPSGSLAQKRQGGCDSLRMACQDPDRHSDSELHTIYQSLASPDIQLAGGRLLSFLIFGSCCVVDSLA